MFPYEIQYTEFTYLPLYILLLTILILIPIALIKYKKKKLQEKKETESKLEESKLEATTTEKIYRKILPQSDIVIISGTLSIIFITLFTSQFKELSIVSAILGSFIFLPIGLLVGLLLFSNWKIKLLRKMTRKNFGIMKFIFPKNIIKPIVVDFDKDIIRFKKGTYFIEDSAIKIEKETEPAKEIPIKEENLFFEEGIPTIYFDVNDCAPVTFTNEKTEIKYRLPTRISATLDKEIAIEKARAMKAFASKQNIMLIVLIAMAGLSLYFSYSNYTQLDRMKTLTTDLSRLTSIITELIKSQPPTYQPNITSNATIIGTP